MIELTKLECGVVSGGNVSVLVPMTAEDANAGFIVGGGLVLGAFGAVFGGALGLSTTNSGVGAVFGGAIGLAVGAVVIPAAFVKTVNGLAEVYRYLGII